MASGTALALIHEAARAEPDAAALLRRSADLIEELHAEIDRLTEALECPTPEMIAAAWEAWRSRHGGKLGPGPGFREAIEAAGRALVAGVDAPPALSA